MTYQEGVRWCRKKLGLTQVQLAAKLRLSDVTIYCWESGQTKPSHDNLVRLCDLAGITLAKFWGICGRASA